MRLFVASLTCSPYNGAEPLVWVSKQKSESLNPRVKFTGNVSVLGRPYVGVEKLNISDEDADRMYDKLESLYQGFKSKLKKHHKNGAVTVPNGVH